MDMEDQSSAWMQFDVRLKSRGTKGFTLHYSVICVRWTVLFKGFGWKHGHQITKFVLDSDNRNYSTVLSWFCVHLLHFHGYL